jgi:hypothetical protein
LRVRCEKASCFLCSAHAYYCSATTLLSPCPSWAFPPYDLGPLALQAASFLLGRGLPARRSLDSLLSFGSSLLPNCNIWVTCAAQITDATISAFDTLELFALHSHISMVRR